MSLTREPRDELRRVAAEVYHNPGFTVIAAHSLLSLLDDRDAWEAMARELAEVLVQARDGGPEDAPCFCAADPAGSHWKRCTRTRDALAKFRAMEALP